ncbi:hypothetical protein GCM10010361_54770 [Streptomyces olivaceiscleroticus]|uniref:Secreted protein n=1 Tax=Streptomyces olivaceiscleroticus TaxID=68245 RepID=A0ABN1ASI0_9ACTN
MSASARLPAVVPAGPAAVAAPAVAAPAPSVPMSTTSDNSHLSVLRMRPPLGFAKVALNLSVRPATDHPPTGGSGHTRRWFRSRPYALLLSGPWRPYAPVRHTRTRSSSSEKSPVKERHSSA